MKFKVNKSFRPVRHTGKTYPKVEAEELADAIGAEEATRVRSGGGPEALRTLRHQISDRLASTGGRPSLQHATRRQKIPLVPEDWETLQSIAQKLSKDRTITPGQVASHLLHQQLKHLKKS